MTEDTQQAVKTKRFRSPPYPMFDLGKAVERASALYSKVNRHEVGAEVLAEAWGMKSVDGKVWRAAAALLQYQLLSDNGAGKNRKFQLTDIAKRIILDEDPDSIRRKEALKTAALAPMIHTVLWDKYGTTSGLGETLVKSYLTIDREEAGEAPYSPSAADEVLSTYRSSLVYAGVSDSDSVTSPTKVKNSGETEDGSPLYPVKINVGDFVKWTSNGAEQFDVRKVQWVSKNGQHLRVIGSMTGIPMNEVTKVDPAEGQPSVPPPTNLPKVVQSKDDSGDKSAYKASTTKPLERVTSSVIGNRLQISADVSADEIDALKDMLTKYKDILQMMN